MVVAYAMDALSFSLYTQTLQTDDDSINNYPKPANTMKKTNAMLLLLAALLTLASCGKDENEYQGKKPDNTQTSTGSNTNDNQNTDVRAQTLEFPHLKSGSLLIVHEAQINASSSARGTNYSTEWDPAIRAQRWSCYQMTSQTVASGGVSRFTGDRTGDISEQYPNDIFLAPQYQFTKDPYWGTGYDHGHICPSADRLSSNEMNWQTFFLTNMQPQANSFNAGIWSNMEMKVRDWAPTSKSSNVLYVCKGGTIDNAENIIRYIGSGENRIPVPLYFFMALLNKSVNTDGTTSYRALGFWVRHDASENESIASKVVNIDELERQTGIDFFCNLPDDIEEKVESQSVDNIKAIWGLR